MELQIEYGNREGQYFTSWRFEELKSLAEYISHQAPLASDWKIWYDEVEDFHNLEFQLENETFRIRFYKVFALQRGGEEKQLIFTSGFWRIVQYFSCGEYKTPAICPECRGSGKGERDPSGAFSEKCPVCEGSGEIPKS